MPLSNFSQSEWNSGHKKLRVLGPVRSFQIDVTSLADCKCKIRLSEWNFAVQRHRHHNRVYRIEVFTWKKSVAKWKVPFTSLRFLNNTSKPPLILDFKFSISKLPKIYVLTILLTD